MNVFDEIYRRDTWVGGSGPGSSEHATAQTKRALAFLVRQFNVSTFTDVGCGDGQWMPDLPRTSYIGVDVSSIAVERSRFRHPDRRYEVVTAGALPPGDMVFCRDVIQHLSLTAGSDLLRQIAQAAGRFMVVSTYIGGDDGYAAPPRSGADAYSPDLTKFPFYMPEPHYVIPDGWDYERGTTMRDPRKVLGLWVTSWL